VRGVLSFQLEAQGQDGRRVSRAAVHWQLPACLVRHLSGRTRGEKGCCSMRWVATEKAGFWRTLGGI